MAVAIDEIQGDYEWFYSSNGEAFDVSDDQFGIRITKNGYVRLFKNGKLVEGHRIFMTDTQNYDNSATIMAGNKDQPITFGLKNDTLTTWEYPKKKHYNYFIKTK